MNIEESNVTKIKFTDVEALDPITIYIEDYEPGKGKITIECFGDSWSYFWGGMSGKCLSDFFLSCNVGYLANCLWDHSKPQSEPDFESIQETVRESVIELRRELLVDSSFAREIYNIDNWEDYAPQHCYDTWSCPDFLDKDDFERLGLHETYEAGVPEKSTGDFVYLARIVEAIQLGFNKLKESK